MTGISYSQSVTKAVSAWQLLNFVRPNVKDVCSELHLTTSRRFPVISRPDHLLVKVTAASLNPIDLLALTGYGESSFRLLHQVAGNVGMMGLPSESEFDCYKFAFPYTPGRDFAGEVVDMGPAVSEFNCGAQIVGATWPFLSSTGSGSLASHIVCPQSYLAVRPLGISPLQAAAVSFAGLTAWSALVNSAGIKPRSTLSSSKSNSSDFSILIIGSTGGVGIVAAQLAQLWGGKVHVICRNDNKAINLMNELKLEQVSLVPDRPKAQYDIILDCVWRDQSYTSTSVPDVLTSILPELPTFYHHLKSSSQSRYVILNPWLLNFNDRWGPLLGSGLALGRLLASQCMLWFRPDIQKCSQLRWAFFQPSGANLSHLLDLMAKGLLTIPIDTIYSFDQVPKAFAHLQDGGVLGKLVINMEKVN